MKTPLLLDQCPADSVDAVDATAADSPSRSTPRAFSDGFKSHMSYLKSTKGGTSIISLPKKEKENQATSHTHHPLR